MLLLALLGEVFAKPYEGCTSAVSSPTPSAVEACLPSHPLLTGQLMIGFTSATLRFDSRPFGPLALTGRVRAGRRTYKLDGAIGFVVSQFHGPGSVTLFQAEQVQVTYVEEGTGAYLGTGTETQLGDAYQSGTMILRTATVVALGARHWLPLVENDAGKTAFDLENDLTAGMVGLQRHVATSEKSHAVAEAYVMAMPTETGLQWGASGAWHRGMPGAGRIVAGLEAGIAAWDAWASVDIGISFGR